MTDDSTSEQIDALLDPLGDWRGAMLSRLRELIRQADPDVVEELKWKKPTNPAGVPVWSDGGMVCTGEVYKDRVKLTFAKGAALDDPHQLFNSSLDAKVRRAIDVHESEPIDDVAFKDLVRAAVEATRRPGGRSAPASPAAHGAK